MKKTKFLCLLMVAALVLSLCSCSNPNGSNTGNNTSVLTFTGTAYTVLPSGTDGSAGPSWTYVHFGDWPQSEKATSVTVDETKSVMQGAYTYYLGSDNAWYAKKSTTYYKVEPIKWRVLTTDYNGTGKKLLFAENILIDSTYYDGCDIQYPAYERIINDTTIYANNYEHSRIRAYLNGLSYQRLEQKYENGAYSAYQITISFQNKGFLQTAFTASGITAIGTTIVDNSAITTDADGYNWGNNRASDTPTEDKIFLLSNQEVTKSDYGFAENSNTIRIRNKTAFVNTTGISDSWCLRSPYHNDICVKYCTSSGSCPGGATPDIPMGIVPALCLE